MPKYEWVTDPVAMSSSETCSATLTGIAKLRPTLPELEPPDSLGTDAPADGTPIRFPEQSVRAPPLFPGLMEASVWIADTSSAVRPLSPGTSIVRLRALTIPEVTVLESPSGAPRATTG